MSALQPLIFLTTSDFMHHKRDKKQADKDYSDSIRSQSAFPLFLSLTRSLPHSLTVALPIYLSVAYKSAKNGRFQQNVFFSLSCDWTRGRGGGKQGCSGTENPSLTGEQRVKQHRTQNMCKRWAGADYTGSDIHIIFIF